MRMVLRRYLNTTTVLRDESFHGGGVETTGELLLLGLLAGHDGHGKNLLVNAPVEVQNVEHLLAGFL